MLFKICLLLLYKLIFVPILKNMSKQDGGERLLTPLDRSQQKGLNNSQQKTELSGAYG